MHADIPEITSMSNVSIGTGSYVGDIEAPAPEIAESTEEDELMSFI